MNLPSIEPSKGAWPEVLSTSAITYRRRRAPSVSYERGVLAVCDGVTRVNYERDAHGR